MEHPVGSCFNLVMWGQSLMVNRPESQCASLLTSTGVGWGWGQVSCAHAIQWITTYLCPWLALCLQYCHVGTGKCLTRNVPCLTTEKKREREWGRNLGHILKYGTDHAYVFSGAFFWGFFVDFRNSAHYIRVCSHSIYQISNSNQHRYIAQRFQQC